jgi:hypothetical protein
VEDQARLWMASEPRHAQRIGDQAGAYHIIELRAKNSEGAIIADDDLIGEPARRSRRLSFCLRKPPVTLCGSSEEVKRLNDPRSNLLPYALLILRSIRFENAERGSNDASAVQPSSR